MKNKKLAIFGALAIGGIVLTAVTTAWGTAKAVRKIDEVKPETKKEAAKLVWKYYIPAGLSVGLTIISDVCFYRIGLKEIAVLTSSVTYLTANRDKLEKKLKEAVGEEKFNEVKEQVRNELVTEFAPKKEEKRPFVEGRKRFPAEETGYGDTLFQDGWSGRFFRSDLYSVSDAIKKFNEAWHDGSYLNYNDLYERWGITKSHQGYAFGWPHNNDCFDTSKDIPFEINRVGEEELIEGYRDIGEDVYVIEIGHDNDPSAQRADWYPWLDWQLN